MEEEFTKELNSYLTFKIGEEVFASNVAKVLNILEMMNITKIPKAPEYLRGVINLRGMVLPVVDTKLKFGMSSTELTTNTCILVMEVVVDNETVKVGALVDSVLEVLEIKDEDIQPPPSIGSKFKSEFIYGMAKKSDEFIMLLDMDKIFSLNEIKILQENESLETENKKETSS